MDFYQAFRFGSIFDRIIHIVEERIDLLKTLSVEGFKAYLSVEVLVDFWLDIVKKITVDLRNWNIAHDTQNELKKSLDEYLELLKENKPLSNLILFLEDQLKRFPIWSDRIENEFKKIKLVVITNETNLNPLKLIESPESFFKPNIWGKLSDFQKDDFKDASKCICVQAWTPAAMISMRFIESALMKFYNDKTKKDPSGKPWGALLSELRKTPGVDQKFIGYFDYLKDFRNNLEHPKVRFSQDETEGAFQHAIHIINQIYK